MPDLFPLLQPQTAGPENGLPLCREAAWDFARGGPVFREGAPVVATGAEAVRVWAYKALATVRGRYAIYSRGFGCDAERLIGQEYSEGLKRAEAARYVREALEINPYIRKVSAVSVSFADGRLSVSVRIDTIYGEVNVNV